MAVESRYTAWGPLASAGTLQCVGDTISKNEETTLHELVKESEIYIFIDNYYSNIGTERLGFACQ